MNPSSSWRAKVDQGLVAVERFHPKLILVEFSADAHRADPTSSLQARDDDYCHLGRRLALMNTKVVFELGSSLSERAWIGAIRSLVIGWEKGIKERALR
jgi:acetoin utilization deacetylase AcuC-like enzyme